MMGDLEYSFMAIALGILAALVSFIIAFRVANYFIAPREHWRQSRYSILLLKLGLAAGAAYAAFMIIIAIFAAGR
ncbi:MAG: hypothetical protein AB7V36_02100 [Bacteroidales bacterium]|jgi:hypothetical protein